MIRKLVFLFFLTVSPTSMAGLLEPSLNSAVPFFKSPDSVFPSGQARRENLIDTLISSSTELFFRVRYENKVHLIKHDILLREIEFSEHALVKEKTSLRLMAEVSAGALTKLNPQDPVEILSLRGPWARVKVTYPKNFVGYVLITEIEPLPQDISTYMNLTEVSLRLKPETRSATVVRLSPKTKLKLIKIENQFGLFQTLTKKGWLELSEVVGRSDFAEMGWVAAEKTWHALSSRSGVKMKLKGQLKTEPLQKFQAFHGLKSSALVQGYNPDLPRGARVEILQALPHRWNQSRLKGHGEVWWKSILSPEKSSTPEISTQQLMNKSLSAISYDSKNKKGLAAASGIYRTLDGKTWKKIDFFGSENWPVCLHPSGAWFVGPFISTDEGETFRPALKWGDVVQRIQSKGSKQRLPHFRVLDIKAVNQELVEMKVDTGVKIARLRSRALSQDWTPVSAK